MIRPKVSIVVPCWGVEKYLDQCVESLINQTLREIEIILVDDVSPDRVPEMCDEWAQKDSRIKVIHKPMNDGLGLACNTGIESATGDFIAFCDSDDWVDPEMYETMYNEAISKNVDAVFTGIKRVDMNGIPYGVLPHKEKPGVYRGRDIIEILAMDMISSAPNIRIEHKIQMSAKVVLYKKKIIDSNSIRFVSERKIPSEDLFFNLNVLAKAFAISVLPDSFYNYRVNTTSITGLPKFGSYSRSIIRYKYTLQVCEALHFPDDYRLRCDRMLIAYTRMHLFSILKSSADKSDKYQEVQSVCHNTILHDVIQSYPLSVMPLVHKIFVYAIKFKSFIALSILSKYRK